jgi:putative addiction module killer protein
VKKVEMLELDNGVAPFSDWLETLNLKTQAKITLFIDRIAAGGSKKNIKALGDGVFEIKIDYGPGYRVYFSEFKKIIILLLIGGDKSSQMRDIRKAKDYWSQYVQK